MNDNSIAISAPTTPENANSSIHKAKSSVSNIILNTLSSSLSKWLSPSDQNGNLRRKRETEPDIELNDTTHGTASSEPPSKRFRGTQNQDEIESHPTTSSKNLYLTRHFSSSTPTTVTPTRRKMQVRNSSPFRFSDQMLTNTRRPSRIETATVTIDDMGDNSTDEEINVQDDATDLLSRELANRKRLNIPPTARPTSRTSNLLSMGTTLASRNRFSANYTHDVTKDDDLEHDALFNGTPNESASESEDSSSRITFTQPNKFTMKRPQSSAGRINTSLVRDDETDQNQRKLSGLFGTGSKRLRGSNNGLINFSAHLQTNKSLFSDKNMPKSLNNSTTSLNSLNRRQSLNNPSLYGSTSALSDSRLLSTNSPFYNGRTMFGGASAYSRRAVSSQRTLRVPTQIRPSSSLSTLYSSTNSLANVDPNTSALSNTAKRILDLMNQCTTPLADVKKMASNVANHAPALVNHRKRFDDNDLMLERSIRLSTPKTPYSRPGASANSVRKSPPTNELQVPTMSQLLQMKKILQNNTEKVREVATASSSILNQTGEYKLPENNDSENASTTRQSKIRNKITTTRASTKHRLRRPIRTKRMRPCTSYGSKNNLQEEYVQEVNLPNISLPAMKNMPDISLPFSKPKTIAAATTTTTTFGALPPVTISKPTLVNSTIVKATQSSSPKGENSTRTVTGQSQFSFSSPTQLKLPLFDKNIDPINNFKFSEPINVEKGTNNSQASAFGTALPSSGSIFTVKTNAIDSVKPVAPLKNASVLEALNIPISVIPPSKPTTTVTTAAVQPIQKSLSDIFKSSNKQWECSCCMIRNDDTKDKCVACETARSQPAPKPIEQTISAPLTNSFGSQFKSNASTWECSACMIRNKLEAQKCIACETPKAGGLEKSVSALPKLAVPSSTDQGFKSIVAQQSARWECTACMTRNDANRKKCECCEQAKPGTSSESSIAFSFGSTSSSTPKFSFGVPFNEKIASTVVPISEQKPKIGEVKPSFSFGVQPNASVTDGPVKTFSFGVDQSKEKDNVKKSDLPATTFSFGVKPTSTSNDNDLSASTKIVSTPALSGFKFGASIPQQIKPETVATTANNKQTTEVPLKEAVRSNELVFGSQNKNDVISSVPLPVVPANIASNTNSTISFGSLKGDQKLPLFGTPISKVETLSSPIQAKPTFGLKTTTSNSNTLISTPQSASLSNKVTPSSSPAAPVFAFGQTQNAAKGGFSFTPIAKDKQAFPMPDFAQSQIKPAATTLSFGSSNVTVTTAAPPAQFGSTFFFGQAATTQAPESSTTSSAFGSTASTPSSGFNFGSNVTAPSQPISTTFGTPQQQQQQQLPATPVFPVVAITSSLPTEPATSPFMFRSTNVESATAFGGQSTTPSFGQPSNTTPIPPFGSFSTQAAATAFSANVNPIGSTIANNATPPTFGSAFGSATQTPNFGSAGNNGLSSSFSVSSFGSPSSGFGSMIHTAPANSDEPSAKKHSPGFGALGNANVQKPPAFSFGDSSSGNASKTSFAFTATASPNFNFSGSQPVQPSPAQPYKFGSAPNAAPAPVFNFGSTEANPPNAPFQFAGSSDVTNNPFAPQGTATNSAATLQRRKIRARRTQR